MVSRTNRLKRKSHGKEEVWQTALYYMRENNRERQGGGTESPPATPEVIVNAIEVISNLVRLVPGVVPSIRDIKYLADADGRIRKVPSGAEPFTNLICIRSHNSYSTDVRMSDSFGPSTTAIARNTINIGAQFGYQSWGLIDTLSGQRFMAVAVVRLVAGTIGTRQVNIRMASDANVWGPSFTIDTSWQLIGRYGTDGGDFATIGVGVGTDAIQTYPFDVEIGYVNTYNDDIRPQYTKYSIPKPPIYNAEPYGAEISNGITTAWDNGETTGVSISDGAMDLNNPVAPGIFADTTNGTNFNCVEAQRYYVKLQISNYVQGSVQALLDVVAMDSINGTTSVSANGVWEFYGYAAADGKFGIGFTSNSILTIDYFELFIGDSGVRFYTTYSKFLLGLDGQEYFYDNDNGIGGPLELQPNYEFDDGSTGWTTFGGMTISGGAAHTDGNQGGTASVSENIDEIGLGTVVRMRGEVTVAEGDWGINFGGEATLDFNGPGTFDERVTCLANTTYIFVEPSTEFRLESWSFVMVPYPETGETLHPIVEERARDGVQIPQHLLTALPMIVDEAVSADGPYELYRQIGGRSYLITQSGTTASSMPSEAGNTKESDILINGSAEFLDVGGYADLRGLCSFDSFTELCLDSANFTPTSKWLGAGDFQSTEPYPSIIEGEVAEYHWGGGLQPNQARYQDTTLISTSGGQHTARMVVQKDDADFTALETSINNSRVAIVEYDFDSRTVVTAESGPAGTLDHYLATEISPGIIMISMHCTETLAGFPVRVSIYPNGTAINNRWAIVHYGGLLEYPNASFMLPLWPTGSTDPSVAPSLVCVTSSEAGNEGVSIASFSRIDETMPIVNEPRVVGNTTQGSPIILPASGRAVGFFDGTSNTETDPGVVRTPGNMGASLWSVANNQTLACLNKSQGVAPGTFSGWTPGNIQITNAETNLYNLNGTIKFALVTSVLTTSGDIIEVTNFD